MEDRGGGRGNGGGGFRGRAQSSRGRSGDDWRGRGRGRGWGRRGGRAGWRGGAGRGSRGGGRGRFSGRGSTDWNDRRPAEPSAETLALMGTRAQESTVGITHFMSVEDSSFAGVLKQRYSDFIVHEVGPDGNVCKGTDFPGLLGPIVNAKADTCPSAANDASRDASLGQPQTDDKSKERVQKGEGDRPHDVAHARGGLARSGAGEDEHKGPKWRSAASNAENAKEDEGGDEEAKLRSQQAEEERMQAVRKAAGALASVLGEETAAKVEAFVLEGVAMKGKDKRTLTLPSTDKATRTQIFRSIVLSYQQNNEDVSPELLSLCSLNTTFKGVCVIQSCQVYSLLKEKLSVYLLAVTVDDPTWTAHATSETPQARQRTSEEPNPAPDAGSSTPHAEAKAANSSTAVENKDAVGEPTDGNSDKPADVKAKPDPQAPKCVQLRIKPDWRNTGRGQKRRRGDLDRQAGEMGRWDWPADRPEFCRFVLYKENSDTMGSVNRICKHFRFSSKVVGYAGTKDKRGVTSQWCTIKRKSIEELRTFNRPLGAFQGAIVLLGNFSYVSEPLKLGELSGNRFGIVLRNVALPEVSPTKGDETEVDSAANGDSCGGDPGSDRNVGKNQSEASEESEESPNERAHSVAMIRKLRETIDQRCTWVKDRGFINYFGLQRFGTGGAPTSQVGLAMLKEDWEGAVRLIMTPRMGENAATHESKVYYLKNPTDIQGTLDRLPFFMDAEKSMMQTLLRAGPTAYVDALKAVPKNLQLMYLHAFQSLLWNLAASERVDLYGREGAVEGDLVLFKESSTEADSSLVEPEAQLLSVEDASAGAEECEGLGDDMDGAADERGAKRAKKTLARLPEVHVVTKDDVENGTYALTDVVLPMPGFGIEYPANRVKDCYTRALEERGLTEACFKCVSQRSFSLGGMYRRLIQVPKDMKWEMKRYDDHTLHLINTDIDDLLDIDDARIAAEQKAKKVDKKDVPRGDEASAGDTESASDGVPGVAPPASSYEGANVSGSGGTQLAPSDEMDAEAASDHKATLKSAATNGKYHGLCLHFTLSAASYATMCVREITRQDTSTGYQTTLNALAPGQHPGTLKGVAVEGQKAGKAVMTGDECDPKSASRQGAVIKIGASFSR